MVWAAAASDHGEVPAADSGRARAEEHRWGMRQLVDGSVRAEGGRRRELHGELGGGGGHGSALAREGEGEAWAAQAAWRGFGRGAS